MVTTKTEQNNGITMINTSNEGTGGLGISYSSVIGRFRVETTELRRVHLHLSLFVVTSNQNASSKN